jgi:hypothetical protein
LLRRLQPFLRSEGIAPLEARYKVDGLTGVAFEPILARLGWQVPQTDRWLLQGRSSQLAAVGWADRHPLQPPYGLVPWDQLSDLQLRTAEALAAEVPGPWPDAASLQPDPQLSLALLHHRELVGWLLVERTGPGSVRYASFFVAPARRGRARAMALLHESFRRQHAAAISLAHAAIAPGHVALERLLRCHLAPPLLAIGQWRVSRTLG